MTDTLKTALAGGAFALLGAIGGAAVTGWSQVELAKQIYSMRDSQNSQYISIMEKLDEQCVACPPATTQVDHETRLRSHTKDLATIKSEIRGAKGIAGAIAAIISAAIATLATIFRGHM